MEYCLDCLGEACPIPLIKTQDKIVKMSIGDILNVKVDHSCAMKNIPIWAEEEGYKVEVKAGTNGEWDIVIEKTK